MHLSLSDIHKLSQDSSPEARADIAGKVAATLSAGVFNEKESELAIEILRALSRDMETRVRKSIVMHLHGALSVPHDLIKQLADDVGEVSVPLLRYSYALTEDDLIDIVRSTREVAKLVAIASRESISGDLSEALLDTKVREVMKTVLANKGAVLRDQQLMKRWDSIAGERSLLEVLVSRGGLSLSVAEKLYAVVTEELKERLARMYRLPMIMVEEATEDAREWATLGMVAPEGQPTAFSEADLEKLVDHLYSNNRLTYSLVIRSLCTGDLGFFETAVARLASVPRVNARILLFDGGPLGFQAIYEKASMPEGFFEAIQTLLRISLEETGYGHFRREDFRQRVMARIQSAGFDRTIENMQYLLTVMGGKVAAAETIH